MGYKVVKLVGYKVVKFQNTRNEPTVSIDVNDPGWKNAYESWIDGKNPTNSKEWKKGVIAITALIDKDLINKEL